MALIFLLLTSYRINVSSKILILPISGSISGGNDNFHKKIPYLCNQLSL